ncbi:MAG: hypothetical protein NDI91_18500 [Sulfuritalea sp.]|nr:hypothetical protein [Sulfuritalea sp.]
MIAGSVSVYLRGDKSQGRKRVALLAPGVVFGEMATRLRYVNLELQEASAWADASRPASAASPWRQHRAQG